MLNEDFKNQLEVCKEIMKKHTPVLVTYAGIAMSMADISHRRTNATIQSLITSAKNWNYFKARYLHKTKSNNWLKMHGYPMRRKIH